MEPHGESSGRVPIGAPSAKADDPGGPGVRPLSGGRLPANHPGRVRRLEDLVSGRRSDPATLVAMGPPSGAKDVFARHFLRARLASGCSATVILTDTSPADARDRLSFGDSAFLGHLGAGRVRFVDARGMGLPAISRLAEKRPAASQGHLILFDSVSTLLASTDPRAGMAFLQAFVARAKAAGATTLLLVDRGVHTMEEVQRIKLLTDGVIEFKAGARGAHLRREPDAA